MKLYIGNSIKGFALAKTAEHFRKFARVENASACVGKDYAKRAKRMMRAEGKIVGANEWFEFENNQGSYEWDNKYSTCNFDTTHTHVEPDGTVYKWTMLQVG